jgi:Tol biopolymer transport system component
MQPGGLMMGLRRVRLVLTALAVLATVGLVCASASGSRDRADPEMGKLRPRTVLLLRTQSWIWALAADGRRIVWITDAGNRPVIRIFDRRTGRLATMADTGLELGFLGLAGRRLIEEHHYGSNLAAHAGVYGAVVGDRRLRQVRWFALAANANPGIGDYYGWPVRAAAGGGTLAFFGAGNAERDPELGVWRLVGRRAQRAPYQPRLLSDIAVDGRRLATLDFVSTGLDTEPAWSPDGREIVWHRGGWPYQGSADESEIWLMRADGSKQRHLADGSNPTWSPDGREIAWNHTSAEHQEVWLMGADGSNQRHLADGLNPVWSPDGTMLAVTRRDEAVDKTYVWLVDADGSSLRRLAEGYLGGAGAWSPDGTTLAVQWSGGISLIDVASGSARPLISGMHSVAQPEWSPDGEWIAFAASPNESRPAIYLVRPDGTALHELGTVDGFALDDQPAWSPDGKRIAYADGNCPPGPRAPGKPVRIINVDGSGSTTPKQSNHCLARPVWSPDGQTVVAGDNPDRPNYSTGGIELLDPAGGPSRWLAPPQKLTGALALRDIKNGKLLREWRLPWQRPLRGGGLLALSGRYLIATYWRPGSGYVLERYDTKSGTLLGRARFSTAASRLRLSGRYGVYGLGRRIYLLDAKTGRRSVLVRTCRRVSPIISGKHILWAENQAGDCHSSRIREIVLP